MPLLLPQLDETREVDAIDWYWAKYDHEPLPEVVMFRPALGWWQRAGTTYDDLAPDIVISKLDLPEGYDGTRHAEAA